jgi:hypothetical protein|tara:strand:+ start:549 stop:803 length:255 start_codon:yes stop_codon:yes gene_type:complete
MKTLRGKEMVTLEERFRKDMLFYESLSKDEARFPQWSTRYDIEQVYKRLKDIVNQFNFVDDVRNESNLPTDDQEKGVIDVASSQ